MKQKLPHHHWAVGVSLHETGVERAELQLQEGRRRSIELRGNLSDNAQGNSAHVPSETVRNSRCSNRSGSEPHNVLS